MRVQPSIESDKEGVAHLGDGVSGRDLLFIEHDPQVQPPRPQLLLMLCSRLPPPLIDHTWILRGTNPLGTVELMSADNRLRSFKGLAGRVTHRSRLAGVEGNAAQVGKACRASCRVASIWLA